jgi:CheY-like chemotaxis protein
VTINLLNNAAKYTPPGGRITVSVTGEGGEVVLRVRDNGIGIPAEKLPHVFELFAQIDLGPERTAGGLGIGLTLVRRLVEMHRGSIAATSAGAGQGSEFIVRLPVTAAPAVADTAPAPLPAPGRHILIVEDNRDSRDSLAALLRLVGHRVDTAEDGRAGVEVALRLRPEVALVDIGLPGLDGYGVARQVRSALGPGVFLVALTGFSQPEDMQRALEAGFDAHLAKPVELEALQTLLAARPRPAAT